MSESRKYLEALLSGDSNIIQDIYNANYHKVKSFVLKNQGQSTDAEDIFQKALLQLATRYKVDKFEIKTSFEAYLFTVCKNLWRRELNKSKNWVTKDGVIELKDENEDLAMAILEQKRWELYSDCMSLLSDNCKKILSLFFAKKTYASMVVELNYNSESVVRQRVFKCKRKLKELIRKDKRFKVLTEL